MKKRIILLTIACLYILFPGNGMSDEGDINIGGFVSQGFLQTSKNNYLGDTKDGTSQFNEMGIYFKTALPNNLRIGVQFFGRDLGEVGNNEIGMNWAFAEKKWSEAFGIRAGLLKITYGLYNETRDIDMLRTSIFLPSSVYNEWLRDGINSINGLEIFGNINLGSAGSLQYNIMNGESSFSTDSGTAKFAVEVLGYLNEISKITMNNLFLSSLNWQTPLEGLRLKGDYIINDIEMEGTLKIANTPVAVDTPDMEIIIMSAEYVFGDFLAVAEYSTYKIDTEIYTSGGIIIAEATTESEGYYVSISYRLNEQFEFGTYYSDYKNDKDGSGSLNELNDICLSAKYNISDNWVAKVECHKMNGLFGVSPESDGSLDEDWYLYAAKLTYFF